MKIILLLLVAATASVIGIDFGSQLIKVSMIKPGKKLSIVQNQHSKRASPSVLTITQDGRLFGNTAQKDQLKKPQRSVSYFKNLLAVPAEDQKALQVFRKANPSVEVTVDEQRQTFLLSVGDYQMYPQEAVSNILEYIKKIAEVFGEGSIKDCAITVPSYWTRAQRMALVYAGTVAKLNIVSLVNDNTAAALYYGLDRNDNETDHLVLFYNMGSSNIQTTVAKYSTVDTKIAGKKRTVQAIQILGHSGEKIGGFNLEYQLADKLKEEFQKKTGKNLAGNSKSWMKLLQATNSARKTLSANRQTEIAINNLFDGTDFKHTLYRSDLQEIVGKYQQKITAPVQNAILMANVTLDDINNFQIIGGVTRIPMVQQILKNRFGMDLSIHLNGDESIAQGASLIAANFSSTVSVKPIWLMDILSQNIFVKFQQINDPDFFKEAVMFRAGQTLGSFRKLSFEAMSDVVVQVDIEYGGVNKTVTRYQVEVEKELLSNRGAVLVFSFVLDYHGIATLYEVVGDFEREIQKEVKIQEKAPENTEKVETETIENKDGSESVNQKQDQEKQAQQEGNIQFKENEQQNLQPKEPVQQSIQQSDTQEQKTTIQIQYKVQKVKLNLTATDMEIPRTLLKQDLIELRRRIDQFNDLQKQKKRMAQVRNDLQSYIYFVKDKLTEDSFTQVTTQEQRKSIQQSVLAQQQEMDSYQFQTLKSWQVTKKQKDLAKLLEDPLQRELELNIRSSSVQIAFSNLSKYQAKIEQIRSNKDWLTDQDVNPVYKTIKETREWINQKVEQQAALDLWQPLAFKTKELNQKVSTAQKAMDRLKRKVKPKQKKEEYTQFDKEKMEEFVKKMKQEQAEKQQEEQQVDDQQAQETTNQEQETQETSTKGLQSIEKDPNEEPENRSTDLQVII